MYQYGPNLSLWLRSSYNNTDADKCFSYLQDCNSESKFSVWNTEPTPMLYKSPLTSVEIVF